MNLGLDGDRRDSLVYKSESADELAKSPPHHETNTIFVLLCMTAVVMSYTTTVH